MIGVTPVQHRHAGSLTRRIAVFGAGLVGCHVGGRLAGAAGVEVTLIGRESLLRELSAAPLRITDRDGADIVCVPGRPLIVTDPASLADADLILVTVKSGATSQAAEAIARNATSTAIIVSLQNGVENVDRLRIGLPGRHVLAGTVPFNVTRPDPGHFHRGTGGRLAVEDHPAIAPWVDIFAAAGLPLTLHRNMEQVAWGKLLINLNNAVNAISGLTLARELANRSYRRVWSQAMLEALDLLQGARIRPARFNGRKPAFIARVLAMPDPIYALMANLSGNRIDPLARSSMADDLLDGRPTEVDHINGAVVEVARRLGRNAPVNAKLVRLVHLAEEGATPIAGDDLLRAIRM